MLWKPKAFQTFLEDAEESTRRLEEMALHAAAASSASASAAAVAAKAAAAASSSSRGSQLEAIHSSDLSAATPPRLRGGGGVGHEAVEAVAEPALRKKQPVRQQPNVRDAAVAPTTAAGRTEGAKVAAAPLAPPRASEADGVVAARRGGGGPLGKAPAVLPSGWRPAVVIMAHNRHQYLERILTAVLNIVGAQQAAHAQQQQQQQQAKPAATAAAAGSEQAAGNAESGESSGEGAGGGSDVFSVWSVYVSLDEPRAFARMRGAIKTAQQAAKQTTGQLVDVRVFELKRYNVLQTRNHASGLNRIHQMLSMRYLNFSSTSFSSLPLVFFVFG